MPAKITPSKTDNSTGEISISDVHKTINDFVTKVELSCIDPTRNPIQKHYHFDIKLDKLTQIIEGSNGAADDTKIRIHLALNLPSQLNCDSTFSLENYLSILVCGVTPDKSSLLGVNDLILVEGFRDFGANVAPDCCVQGNPPNS